MPPGLGYDWRQVMSPGELGYIFLALIVAAVVAFLLTPVAIRVATRAGAIDMPDEGRRVHRTPIPRGGGLAVVVDDVMDHPSRDAVGDPLGPVGDRDRLL